MSVLKLRSTSGSTAASNNVVWSSILPADFCVVLFFFFPLDGGLKAFFPIWTCGSAVSLFPEMTYFLPPPLRGWTIMGEIDNPVAHRCWIYDNVRQRSSMNWIRLCCVGSCLALVSSWPTLVSSLLKLDFQRQDHFQLVQVQETLMVSPIILSTATLLSEDVVFFLLHLTPLRTLLRSASVHNKNWSP